MKDQYQSKPVKVLKCVQWTGDNQAEVEEVFAGWKGKRVSRSLMEIYSTHNNYICQIISLNGWAYLLEGHTRPLALSDSEWKDQFEKVPTSRLGSQSGTRTLDESTLWRMEDEINRIQYEALQILLEKEVAKGGDGSALVIKNLTGFTDEYEKKQAAKKESESWKS